ncbi:MAG: Glu-tRNA(Gln) amidotransferase subunit GatE [Thermoplasmata archaeon]|nr:Glu-tRNA(Gln) amidotransferase subunit GatE [Thermoplasmata archaeon]
MLDPANIDYKGLGFKAGLEIHHQLKAKRKLFCHCPAELDTELQKTPEYIFHRRFRAVMGEMGDFDPGMLVEVEKGYLVIYHANDAHVCTYEMDETPPFWIDNDSIDAGFHLASLFNCESPAQEIVVNRKQYLDGSITTGFQRTFIVARDGHVELPGGKKVPITNILIEEDSARKIKTEDRGRTVYYNLDRLGVPLTEIITDHNAIDTPEELIETAKMIGLNLRTTGLARRGIGVARQDVNISIDGGNRAELKGVQDLAMLPKHCAHEVCRQDALIEIKARLEKMPIEKDDFEHTYVDISHLFDVLAEDEKAYAVHLPQFENILMAEIQPQKDFGFEIFEKCNLITGVGYDEMFHSGEAKPGSIRRSREPDSLFVDARADGGIRKVLNLQDGDGYLAARGSEKPVLHTLKITVERCKQAFDGVPQETRRVLPNGNNEFLRVIHGKERLYPDTDTPPEPYPIYKLERIRKTTFNRPLDLLRKYGGQGLTMDRVELIIRDEKIEFFIKLVDDGTASVSTAYRLLIELPRWLARKGQDPDSISSDMITMVARAVTDGELAGSKLRPLLLDLAKSSSEEAKYDLLAEYKAVTASEKEDNST